MRRLLAGSVLILAIVIAFAHAGNGQEEGYTETQVQRSFAESVKALPNVIQASWQSPLDLWVYADGVNEGNAEAMADKVVLLAQTELGQSVCVHIHNGDYNALATKCWSSL